MTRVKHLTLSVTYANQITEKQLIFKLPLTNAADAIFVYFYNCVLTFHMNHVKTIHMNCQTYFQ